MNTPKQIANYIKEYFLSKTGNNTLNGHLFVDTANAYDLGSATNPFRAVYATTITGAPAGADQLVAVQSGDTPNYLNTVLAVTAPITKSASAGVLTIGLSNTPLWADGTQALTGNLSVNVGVTIDGVDLSVFKSDYDTHVANINAHHNKLHNITDAAHHSVTGAQYSVIGLSATDTLGVLSTTTDGSVNFNTILRSSGAGNLKMASLTTVLLNSSGDITIQPTTDIILDPNTRVKLATNKLFEIGGAGFASGFAGNGGRFDYNVSRASKATLELDDLYVRGRMNVYELVIQQIRATNGNLFVSDSAKLSAASLVSGSTYELTVDGDTNDYQPFAVGDILRAQRVNLGSGLSVWQSDLEVTSISPGGNVKKFRATLVSGTTPAAGMEFVRLGSSSDSSRRGTIYLTASDSNAPFIDISDGVTSHATFNTSGNIKVRLGKLSGISDADFTMTGYGLYSTNVYLKGIISAASNAVRIDSTGIRLKSAAGNYQDYGAYKFHDSSNNLIGGLYGAEIVQLGASYTNSMALKVLPSTYGAWMSIFARAGTGASQEARISIGIDGDTVGTKSININFIAPGGASGVGYIQLGDTFSTTQYITNLAEFRAANTIRPSTDLGQNLGHASYRWGTLYVNQIIATTISGTTMNGAEWEYTGGNMVIDANNASNTTVSIVNQGAGSASLSVERDLTVGNDIIVTGLVDGVDVSLLSSNYTSHAANVNAHHNRDHELASTSGLGATHTVSGLTSGQVLKATGATTALFVQLNHSELAGLTGTDNHTQYVHNTIARTISAVHTFNPSVAGAWITLGANATGQLITGLNADLLDGYDSAAFPRKAENATIAGTWTFNGDITFGTGVQITYANEAADKIYFSGNTYGIGTETSTLTRWSPTNHRWRIGGTSASTGTQYMNLDATGLKIGGSGTAGYALDVTGAAVVSSHITSVNGTLTISSDSDGVDILHKGRLGFLTGVAGEFAISHFSFGTASNYMIKQTSTGNVMVNAPSGNYVDVRINNASKLKVDTNITTTLNLGINMTPTVALDVTGEVKSTGAASFNFDTNTANYIGKAKIGYVGHTNAAGFGYHAVDNTSYAFRQGAGLSTYFNAGAAQWIYYRIGDVDHMILKPAGLYISASKLIQSATFNSSTPIAGFSINEISGNKYSLTIGSMTADELRVRTFVADETRIDRGDEWWGKGYGIVQTAWTTPAGAGGDGVEAWFENAPSLAGAIFSDGDWIFIRLIDNSAGMTIQNIWGQVYTAASGLVNGYLLETTPTNSVNRQRWRFVLRSGPVSTSVPVNVTAVNFGASGQAMIRLSTVDTAGAPYIKMGRWSGSDPYTPANHANEVIIGKLTAISGPTGTVGIYSAYGSSSFELSDAGALLKSLPIQSWNGANQTFNVSSTGTDLWVGVSSGDKRLTWNGTTLAITGTVTATAGVIGGWTISGNTLTSTDVVIDAGNSKMSIGPATTFGSKGIQLERNGSFPRAYIGNGTTQYLQFNGSVLTWAAANTSLDASGNLTATSATLSGAITATSGAIGGWSVASTTISATNITLTSGAANIANILAGTGANAGGINSANASGDIVFWAGSTHANRATATFRVTAGGALTSTSATITGAITATSGDIGTLSVSGKLTMSGASSAIAIGTTPPTSASAGTGIWIDRTGYYGLSAGTYQVKIDATNGKLYAGAGNVILDVSGISLTTVTGDESDIKWNYSGSKFTWLGGDVQLASEGRGYLYINSKARSGTDPASRIILNAYNASEASPTTLEIINEIGTPMKYAYLNSWMQLGNTATTLLTTNVSTIVAQHNSTASSISLANTGWGNAAHIGFNAYMADTSASYSASGAWKFLGTQYTGNVTRSGLLTWDGNGGYFRFNYSEAGRTATQDITTWTAILDIGVSGVKVIGDVGFNNTTPITKPTVTGSRGGNAALASLLTALANYGLITNSSTA